MRSFSLSALLYILADFHLYFDVFPGGLNSYLKELIRYLNIFSAILNQKTTNRILVKSDIVGH